MLELESFSVPFLQVSNVSFVKYLGYKERKRNTTKAVLFCLI